MKWKQCLKRYIWSILLVVAIIGGLVISFLLLGELNPTIAAIGGLLFSVPIRFFWLAYTSPVLAIKGAEPVIFDMEDDTPRKWRYAAYRIIIQNEGRSAAKNCKGYIIMGERKERICWTIPKERPNATINAKDNERLDFCAFYKDGFIGGSILMEGDVQPPRIIAPTENGWPGFVKIDPYKCRKLDGIKECQCLITADNTDPIGVDIIINDREGEIEIK